MRYIICRSESEIPSAPCVGETARAVCHSRLADLYHTCSLWMADMDDGAHIHEAAALYEKFRHHVWVAEESFAVVTNPPMFPVAESAEERLAGFKKKAPAALREAIDAL